MDHQLTKIAEERKKVVILTVYLFKVLSLDLRCLSADFTPITVALLADKDLQ